MVGKHYFLFVLLVLLVSLNSLEIYEIWGWMIPFYEWPVGILSGWMDERALKFSSLVVLTSDRSTMLVSSWGTAVFYMPIFGILHFVLMVFQSGRRK